MSEANRSWLVSLVEAWEGRLVRYTARYVKTEVARELVQEAFLRLWAADKASVQGHEKEWLFRVCRNLAIDYLRRQKNFVLKEEEGVLVPETEENLAEHEADSLLQKAIRELPSEQREVVRLKFQESLSYKEISSITGHSVSHVGVLIFRATERLRKSLENTG